MWTKDNGSTMTKTKGWTAQPPIENRHRRYALPKHRKKIQNTCKSHITWIGWLSITCCDSQSQLDSGKASKAYNSDSWSQTVAQKTASPKCHAWVITKPPILKTLKTWLGSEISTHYVSVHIETSSFSSKSSYLARKNIPFQWPYPEMSACSGPFYPVSWGAWAPGGLRKSSDGYFWGRLKRHE